VRRALLLAAALAAAVPGAPEAGAQTSTCRLEYQQGGFVARGPEGQRVISAGGPLLVRCTAGEELRADSADIFQATDEVHLFGRVDYKDPARTLTSDYATYNSRTGRLWATGNVVFTDRVRGSTLRGPTLEYFRATETRPEPEAIATGRPHLTVVPRDEGTGRRDPMEVDADRITTVGERYVTANGRVEIRSTEMNGAADEAFYDSDAERLELRRNARATGDRFELTGGFIRTDLRDGALQYVLAREDARLVNERLQVDGPQLQLWFADDLLQRLVSGQVDGGEGKPGRSVALATGFRLEADSLEAILPAQQLREVHAIGTAQGEAWDADRVSGPALASGEPTPERIVELARQQRDLLFADTVIGFFRQDTAAAPAAEGAPEPEPELERMLAVGEAWSLYQGRADGRNGAAGINYVTGDRIDLAFSDGEVDVARVQGLKRGLYLDPLATGAPAPAAPGAEPPAGEPTDDGADRPEPPAPPTLPAPPPPASAPEAGR
jgi:lipopolysaccharide export system protein LptA